MNRRDFLKLTAASAMGATLPSCDSKWFNLLGSDEEKFWGLNVHPYGGSLDALQIQALHELGVRKIRITLGLGRDLAGPYLNAYPADYLGIITDFFKGRPPDANAWPGQVADAVHRSPGVSAFQVLNEPDVFHGISPEVYVNNYLRPAFEVIKSIRPGVPVVSAAPANTSGGRIYFFQMTEAGADNYCDFRAVHMYSSNPEVFLAGTDKPFMVTESGTRNRANHLSWWQNDMSHISRILDTDMLYWYVLLDRPDDGLSLISDQAGPGGAVQPISDLYNYIRSL
jgi:hypothetical protein